MIDALQVTLPLEVDICVGGDAVPLFNSAGVTDLKYIDSDQRFVAAADFFASVKGGLDVSVVGCHSIHQEVGTKLVGWECAWHGC